MSTWNAAAVVETLKWTVSPALTLICVAHPWIVASPAPLTSHVVRGVPGRQFSAMTGFAGDAHGSAAPAAGIDTVRPNAATIAATTIEHVLWSRVISVRDRD